MRVDSKSHRGQRPSPPAARSRALTRCLARCGSERQCAITSSSQQLSLSRHILGQIFYVRLPWCPTADHVVIPSSALWKLERRGRWRRWEESWLTWKPRKRWCPFSCWQMCSTQKRTEREREGGGASLKLFGRPDSHLDPTLTLPLCVALGRSLPCAMKRCHQRRRRRTMR